eukprot:COSAG06_NODE_349_length_16992_cov_9.318712_11_plen_252_part_00
MRGQVYTAIVHGATGIMFFSMDGYTVRAGGVVGIAPAETANTTYRGRVNLLEQPAVASPSQVEMSVALWNAVAKLNSELLSLSPFIFAPTSTSSYSVSFRPKCGCSGPWCTQANWTANWSPSERESLQQRECNAHSCPFLACCTACANRSETPLRVLRKTDASSKCAGDVFIVANVDKSALTARFHVPGLKCTQGSSDRPFEDEGRQQQHFNPIEVMFEQGRSLPCNANSSTFEDDFEEYGVHVYKLTDTC